MAEDDRASDADSEARANTRLRLCLGIDAGGGYQPAGFETRLEVARAGASASERACMERVLAEDWAPDWTRHSLAEESRRFAEHLARTFPALDSAVVRALANRWAYGWR